MYKILITTSHSTQNAHTGSASALDTQVVDFDMPDQAYTACEVINDAQAERGNGSNYNQCAVILFRP